MKLQFYITNESSEDTLESAANLDAGIPAAVQVAKQGQAGDPVSIVESGGRAVRQSMLMLDESVSEQMIAHQIRKGDVQKSSDG